MGDIYFNGTALAGGKKVKFNGSDMANVYFNGTKIWTEYTPTANTYTSNATEQLNDNLSQITIEIAGAVHLEPELKLPSYLCGTTPA